jgi:hypothetical protein
LDPKRLFSFLISSFDETRRLESSGLCLSKAILLVASWLSNGLYISRVSSADEIRFSRDIRPILSEYCFSCHGPDDASREAGLRLDDEASAKHDHEGLRAIVPGRPEESEIIQRIESSDPDLVMPPSKLLKTISAKNVSLLKRWIEQGATWGKHWSYEAIRRPELPKNGESNPIDAWLKEALAKDHLTFSSRADRSTLIRRLALDITGLPPTLDELDELSSKDHEDVVAFYLGKPSFGEHWAREWLDIARYADSAGYPSDPGREIWLYRDWVISALNDNMPFDQFTIEQIAGDLLPNPSESQRIATAFHRNTMTQNEGGTNDEEFRSAAVIDRVTTTFAVWMGTTMTCAQCHTHKYDPITNKEFFQVYAILNQTADADKKDESPTYTVSLEPKTKELRESQTRELKNLQTKLAELSPGNLIGFEEWLKSTPTIQEAKTKEALARPAEERTAEQNKLLQKYFVKNVSEATKSVRVRVAEVQKAMEATKPATVPVMVELDDSKRRKTFVQLRGNWQSLGEEVEAGVPAVFHPLADDSPRNRLGLARWLVSPNNTLTARVIMNRMWESIFGIGIVRSSEEFGSQGDLPVHPELLDWLASEFVDSGWDVKHMLTLIFNSQAYCQVSKVTPELLELDPDNRRLTRGPRFRASGELLRDQALAVSGLLSSKMFGPPVRPMRPNLGLNTAFGGSNDWEPSRGEDRYRRSVYTEIRRTSPYPGFTTFDAPNRETCTLRRGRSNTPLQAYVTLNDPVFVEASQAMARRLLRQTTDNENARIDWLFRLCLARDPSTFEREKLLHVLDEAKRVYAVDNELAEKMATEPLGKLSEDDDAEAIAAWTAVANVVMNLDEFLMRR